ncbi:MAG: hypothetical protein IJA55_10175 [Clostridia bacterium]|nr:hypothetical protein [Clostridia bacterium]
MSNPIKKEYDKLSITKDIIERENIIRQFQTNGFLDRNKAIEKIMSLQLTDADMAIATVAKQTQCGSVDLYQVDDNLIVSNMQFQIDFLKAKLAKLKLEDKNG